MSYRGGRAFSAAAYDWIASYNGSIDTTALLMAFDAGMIAAGNGATLATRRLRECPVCREQVPMSHATEQWEARHRHEATS